MVQVFVYDRETALILEEVVGRRGRANRRDAALGLLLVQGRRWLKRWPIGWLLHWLLLLS